MAAVLGARLNQRPSEFLEMKDAGFTLTERLYFDVVALATTGGEGGPVTMHDFDTIRAEYDEKIARYKEGT